MDFSDDGQKLTRNYYHFYYLFCQQVRTKRIDKAWKNKWNIELFQQINFIFKFDFYNITRSGIKMFGELDG